MSNTVQIVKDTALNKTQIAEVFNGAQKVYNNQSTPAVMDVNIETATGAHGLATEATLDSLRTENASNLGALDSSLTDGTAVVKCMGIDGATPRQLKVDGTGALHIISENADSMLIKGVETGTTTQRDCKQNANGDLRVQLIANDGNDGAGAMRIAKCETNGVLGSAIKGVDTNSLVQRDCKQNANGDLRVQLIANDGNDGAGTMRIVKCDANGVLDSSGGGGGGGAGATTYNDLAFTILKPTAPATSLQTNSAGIDLTNCSQIGVGGIYFTYQTSLGGDTADISEIVVQYSDDNTNWWSDATPMGGGSFVPTTNLDGTSTGFSTFFLEVMGFKARFIRLCALHIDNTGIDMATTAHLQLRPF